MGTGQIHVSSVTYAMMGQKVLSSYGIKSRVKRTQRRSSKLGCGYSLEVSSELTDKAMEILVRNGVKVIGFTEGRDQE